MTEKLPTLQDIARETGYSKSTVSRALQNYKHTSSSTTAKVKAAAERLGYAQHPYVQTLMAQRRQQRDLKSTANLAFLNDYPSNAYFKNRPIAEAIYQAAKCRTRELGWSLTPYSIHESVLDTKQLIRLLTMTGVQGIILGRNLDLLREIPNELEQFSLVSEGTYWAGNRVDCVTTDLFSIIFPLLRYLKDHGAQRTAIYFPAHILKARVPIVEVLDLLCGSGEHYFIIEPTIRTSQALNQALEKHRADALLFHQREERDWLVDYLIGGHFRGAIAEYIPPPGANVPWASTFLPVTDLGKSLADLVIEKVTLGKKGFSKRPRKIQFSGELVIP